VSAPTVEIGRPSGQLHRATIGSQQLDLDIVPVADEVAIALLMTVDRGVRFNTTAGEDLAAALAPLAPDVVVGTATLGIPVAFEVSRALELDDVVILQKTRKVHLGDALSEPLTSITTTGSQSLLLDRRRAPVVAGRRVVLVDDVIATGGSIRAGLRLLRAAGAEVVGVGSLLVEADGWRAPLGPDADLVRTLGVVPVFGPAPDGTWVPLAP
jgi:adenine/guanine phosphoribosyltransferase-like PRPP-binding protein